MLGMVMYLDVTNKIWANVTSTISGREHLRVRVGCSQLPANAVATQEAMCWEADARNNGIAHSQNLRVTVQCEKQLYICPCKFAWELQGKWEINLCWLKPRKVGDSLLELQSLSLPGLCKMNWSCHMWVREGFTQEQDFEARVEIPWK